MQKAITQCLHLMYPNPILEYHSCGSNEAGPMYESYRMIRLTLKSNNHALTQVSLERARVFSVPNLNGSLDSFTFDG